MQRFILSTLSVLLATAAVAQNAQAAPKVDSDFSLQTLRLQALDARTKSEQDSQPYYPQSYPQTSSQDVAAEQESIEATEPTAWEAPEAQEEAASTELSLIERRQQVLDRS